MSAIQVVEGSRHPVLDAPAVSFAYRARRRTDQALPDHPTFNEARNLPELVSRLTSVLDDCLPAATR